MWLCADQGAYAAVCRARNLCSCMQGKEPMQLYAGQGAYAAVCRPRSIVQLYAGQGAYAAVCRVSDFELHESRDANVACAYLL